MARAVTFLFGLVFITLHALPAFAAETCYPDWSVAAPIVAREKLVAAKRVHQLARQRYRGDLKKITLCKSGNEFIYRLVFFEQNGRIWHLKVDARRPFEP